MPNKKKIYISALLAVVLICVAGFVWSWFVTKDIRKDTAAALNKSQKVAVKNLVLTESKEGKKYWELCADEGSYDSAHGQVTLNHAVGNFYNKEQEVALSFEALSGTYNEADKVITLLGDILIVTKDGSSIRADKMIWKGQNENIVASGNVNIKRNDQLNTVSQKAIFNSELTYFKIQGKTRTEIFATGSGTKQGVDLTNTVK